ncbi:LacI family transcriptional regulator [Kitasatospora herbaricolor]|uniref:substrate-binding domain-containing protein n=1 Tax=Kitasatospora herbaricolor TaxID=68217 RepID=UPI00174D53AA|nr:substrate-binding domain-containing protein [Kitasatospora herbaricolor]MDQ0312926.1 LacI family transcriptional regulator [Kitasatospora herbaricolor]GGV25299.1 LacI family transcriptional regulator [Kitasatospora herbaricolor]
MNGQALVADRTRDTVRQAIERLGAAPGTRSRTPARPGAGRTPARPGAVFVRCPYLLTDYFGIIVSSIAETLDLHGRQLILNAGGAAKDSRVLADLPDRPEIAGALLILPTEEGEELEALRARDFPFVVVDPRTPVPRDIAAVSASHFTGARNVAAHLVALGHRRIGLINGPGDWLASSSRFAGHASALAEVGVLVSPELVSSIEPTSDWGYSAAGRLLDLPDRPTALATFNDKAAVGALRAAHERGLRVPEDLSITGFDDVYLSSSTVPMLTTVRQPLEELGRMAVSLLTRLMEGHTVEALHVELATELVVRGSTGPAPAG